MRPRRINKPLRVITSIDELPVVCTADDAGLLLRRYPEAICRMARNGELKGKLIGHRWMFRRDDLVEYLNCQFSDQQNGGTHDPG